LSDTTDNDAGGSDEEVSPRKMDALRRLASKNFGKFAVQVQHMSEEVQKKLIDQLPEFRELASAALDSADKAFQSTLKSNDESDKIVHEAYQQWRASLQGMLADPDLTLEEKLRITAEIGRTVKGQHRLNAESKVMKLQMFGRVVLGTAAVVGTVVVAITGGKFMLDQGDSST
jgi:hypothetical protein